MLQSLHLSGKYDRIVVIAHSLGTVIAYDMLRAYYSRINEGLPDPHSLGSDFLAIDEGNACGSDARQIGRNTIRAIQQKVSEAAARIAEGHPMPGDESLRSWLVTDFVTLGSPLAHAPYLMCRGSTEDELTEDFRRKTSERELLTCPPKLIDDDKRLTFVSPNGDTRKFHHSGLFGLTRWTNLYFPTEQLLWGDAVGGEVGPIFGDGRTTNIVDIPISLDDVKSAPLFGHVRYWEIGDNDAAPHIKALRDAVDLADCRENPQ